MILITISLCMIVKNEEKLLGRALSSIAPAVEEIIIADTGSCDKTKEIAKKYGAKIFDFPWQDSFCQARNFSFSKASMDYCMWMDADDWLPSDSLQKLLDLKASLSPQTHVVMLPYACGFSQDDTPSLLYFRERIIKNHAGFSWEGLVHECITPRGNIIYGDAQIWHLPPNDQCHTLRNLKIYEKAQRLCLPFGPRDRFYYGRELMSAGRYSQAIPLFTDVIEDDNAWKENRIQACADLSACFLSQNNPSQALEALFKSFVFDCPRAHILCDLGDIFRERAQYSQAIFWYELALTCKEDQKSGAFIRKDCYGYYPCVCLCVCYHAIGDLENALKYHKKSGQWHKNTREYLHNEAYFQNLQRSAK